MQLVLRDAKGKDLGKVKFLEEITLDKINTILMHEVVVNYLANRRRGTACTKTRSEVSGGGRKPWKQKGTGRARVGSNRSPLWRHGGVTFGPKPRDYSYSMPVKKKQKALLNSLFLKNNEEKLYVIDSLNPKISKTKEVANMLKVMGFEGRILFVLNARLPDFERASRNIKNFNVTHANKLNAYNVLTSDSLVIAKDALDFFSEKFGDKDHGINKA